MVFNVELLESKRKLEELRECPDCYGIFAIHFDENYHILKVDGCTKISQPNHKPVEWDVVHDACGAKLRISKCGREELSDYDWKVE